MASAAAARVGSDVAELVGLIIGFLLTLMVFSYLLGDNPLYRLAVHLLVGVGAAYGAVVVIRQVLWPGIRQLFQTPVVPANLLWLAPIGLSLLLFLGQRPQFRRPAAASVAFMVGVGAAVAVSGAVIGTLWPQVTAFASDSLPAWQSLLAALLTALTLLAFQFTRLAGRATSGRLSSWSRGASLAGQAVVAITLGAVFAGVFNTGLVLLIARVSAYLGAFWQLLA
jgi:hypothetical protein